MLEDADKALEELFTQLTVKEYVPSEGGETFLMDDAATKFGESVCESAIDEAIKSLEALPRKDSD